MSDDAAAQGRQGHRAAQDPSDAEFPELPRRVVDQGARVIFVPTCIDDRAGYLRVRYCRYARAVENQSYVVLAGNTGNLADRRADLYSVRWRRED